jgi:hypothetical protein
MTGNRWGTYLHGATAWVALRTPEPSASDRPTIRPSVRPAERSTIRPASTPARQGPHALKIVQLLQDFQG